MPFAGIIGQDRAVAVLRRSVASGKIAHAYLFTGVEGCGKKKTALAFIEALFCGRDEGCGSCPSCRKIALLSHPDLHLLEPDGAFIKIDQVRELQKELAYRPYEATRKACIIDGADRLNPAAGNALLKTLEEPPGNALIILLTSTADNVLPTVRSRCQHLNFQGLAEDAIAAALGDAGHDPESARVAASLAEGSLGRALALAAEGFLAERTLLLEKVGSLSLGEMGGLFRTAEELGTDREKAQQVLDLLAGFLRDVLQHQSGTDTFTNRDLTPLIGRHGTRNTPERVMAQIAAVTRTRRAVQRNANVRLAFDLLFMELADGPGA